MKLGREAVVFTRTAFEARGLSLFLRRDRCLNGSRCHGDAAAPLPAFESFCCVPAPPVLAPWSLAPFLLSFVLGRVARLPFLTAGSSFSGLGFL